MKRQLMNEQWNQFVTLVLPPNCPPAQKQEMRRAFYAGAQSILFRVLEKLAPESETTESDLNIMDDIHQELQDFAQAVRDGKA